MIPLSSLDQLFFWLENSQRPMHVGGLQLFSFPENAPDDYLTKLAETLHQYQTISPPFNRRLATHLGQRVWVEDADIDLGHHLRFEALPKPGRIRELLAFISNEHSQLMDRHRPLWEFHVVEGFEHRQFALYTKIHHGFVDGVSTMRLMQRMLSADPAQRSMPPVWALPPPPTHETDSDGSFWQALTYLFRASGHQLGTLPKVTRELLHTVMASRKHSGSLPLFQAPHTILNQHITNARRFAAQSFDLSRIRGIGQHFHCTVNDVILAICGHALRAYLQQRDALPEAPLIAMVPVSLRQDDSAGGNQVGMLLTSLGTDMDDPVERLIHIHESTQEAKARYSQLSPAEITNYNAFLLAPACFNLLTGLAPRWQTFNVIISNIPGPKEPMYWNGARLEGIYPVSIPFDRLALNITLTSYCDQIEFGLIGCKRTVPGLQRLLDYLAEGLALLEQQCSLASAPGA